MKKILKVIGYALLVIVVLVGGLLTYVATALPNVGDAPNLTVERTAERVERGRYLANHVSMCINCHSERDWSQFAGPVVPGSTGKGGEVFDRNLGFPGVFYAKNITPANLSRYTDGELFRCITTGVTKEGKPLFPLMPYSHYGKMDPEDINAIIAYLRTLEPTTSQVPESEADFPMSLIMHIIPQKAEPGKLPAPGTKDYGAYMVNATACIECHTREKQGQIIPEFAFSGGREFRMPNGTILRSPNITPDPQTGIGTWTEEAFIKKFKDYADNSYTPPTVEKDGYNTIMPWTSYAHMTREDLAAIYQYLMALPAQQNTVVRFTPRGVAGR